MVDLLREHAAHHGAPVLEGDGRVVRDRLEQRASSSVNGVSWSATSSPISRRFQRSGVRTACLPARLGHAMRPSSRTSAAPVADGVHRRLDDRLERLLEVEGLGDRFGDLCERLELGDPALCLGVELRVDDRLRDLARDRLEQLDLVLPELARLARAHVERARELVAGEDRHGEDRLVLRLRQVRELLPARVEVRLGGDRDGPAIGGGGAGDPFSGRRRGRRVISSSGVPCVARRTSSPAASS